MAELRDKLAMDEAAHGPEGDETADTINNLAVVLLDRGKVEEAEVMFRRVLAIFEKTRAGALLHRQHREQNRHFAKGQRSAG